MHEAETLAPPADDDDAPALPLCIGCAMPIHGLDVALSPLAAPGGLEDSDGPIAYRVHLCGECRRRAAATRVRKVGAQ